MYLGVKGVIAKSIERIHAANLVNFGIVPFTFEKESDWDLLSEKTNIRIPGIRRSLEKGDESVIAHAEGSRKGEEVVERKGEKKKDEKLVLKMNLSRRQRMILLAGGLLPFTVMSRKGNKGN
jgi:aconitate hydratase